MSSSKSRKTISQSVAEEISQNVLLFSFVFLAVLTYLVPMQKYLPLSRFQHYGLATFVFGMGYLVQLVWSWKLLSRWYRIAYFMSSGYILTASLILYANPWLDSAASMYTETQKALRYVIVGGFGIMFLPLFYSWYQTTPKETNSKTIDKAEEQPDKTENSNS